MRFGLTDEQYAEITDVFQQHPEIEKVCVFGSRAMGNHKPASDVDLLLVGAALTSDIVANTLGRLNDETRLPFVFDVLDDNDDLPLSIREHIDQYGQIFYVRAADAGPQTRGPR